MNCGSPWVFTTDRYIALLQTDKMGWKWCLLKAAGGPCWVAGNCGTSSRPSPSRPSTREREVTHTHTLLVLGRGADTRREKGGREIYTERKSEREREGERDRQRDREREERWRGQAINIYQVRQRHCWRISNGQKGERGRKDKGDATWAGGTCRWTKGAQ